MPKIVKNGKTVHLPYKGKGTGSGSAANAAKVKGVVKGVKARRPIGSTPKGRA